MKTLLSVTKLKNIYHSHKFFNIYLECPIFFNFYSSISNGYT
nr:MAG TPA_asm: hypothetical protein [Caudoviricetes sp.]